LQVALGYINSYDFDCKQITWTTDGANAGTVFLREGKHNCTNVCGTLLPIKKNENLEYLTYTLGYATTFYKRPDTNGAKIMNGGRFTPKNYPDEMEERIQKYRKQGIKLPPRKVLRTPEQIEGIKASALINTGVLDHVAAHIREGMSTAEIDKLVYDYTLAHGAIPAPLNYEGFPKSVCTSINDVVCHGIPSEDQFPGTLWSHLPIF
jgi:hypothetical protein